MLIERNLYPSLRSKIERTVERKEEFSSSKVLVDRDKGRQNQQNLTKEEELQKPAEQLLEEKVSEPSEIKPVLTRKLDLMA